MVTASSATEAGPELATPERTPPGPSAMVPEYPIRRSAIETLSPRGVHLARTDVGAPATVSTDALRAESAGPGSSTITIGKG